jgi:hypothetical protein
MAAKDRAEQGAHQGAALLEALRQNPYVVRLLEDEDLRDQLKDAVDNSRSAYKRAAKAKNTPQALLKDKKLQKQIKEAFESANVAQQSLRAPAHTKKRRGRLLLVLLVGAVVALVASSALRDKVLDLLFGPEETFDYVPTANGNGTGAATPQTPAPNAS